MEVVFATSALEVVTAGVGLIASVFKDFVLAAFSTRSLLRDQRFRQYMGQ